MTVLVEVPLARLLIAGMGRSRALDTLRRITACPEARDEARRITGSRIEINEDEDDVQVQCVFALRESRVGPDGWVNDDGIYWDNRGVVARGHSLPEILADQAAGRRVDEIIAHPLLAGIHVAWARNEEDGVLVVEAADSLWTIERIETDA